MIWRAWYLFFLGLGATLLGIKPPALPRQRAEILKFPNKKDAA